MFTLIRPNLILLSEFPARPSTWLITTACLMIQTLGQSWLLSLDLPCSVTLDNAGGSYHASCVVSLRSLILTEQSALTTPWQHVGQAVVFKKWQITITFQFTGLGGFFLMTETFEVRELKVSLQSQLQCQYCEIIITIAITVAKIRSERTSFEPINWRKLFS